MQCLSLSIYIYIYIHNHTAIAKHSAAQHSGARHRVHISPAAPRRRDPQGVSLTGEVLCSTLC